MRTIPVERARRIALGAQGFATPRAPGRVDVRHFRRVLDASSVVQLDSVNVSARAHYLPFFSRLGPYDPQRLDDWLWRSRENFEYAFGHEASVMPLRVHRLMRHRMTGTQAWGGVQRAAEEHPGYIEQVLREVAEDGPLSVSDLADAGSRGASWWGWNLGRVALDWLYVKGDLAVHHRDAQFALVFDLHDRVIPPEVVAEPDPPRDEALRELLLLGARAHGIGTARDLADHFRVNIREARPLLAELAAAGELEEVRVAGLARPRLPPPRGDHAPPHRRTRPAVPLRPGGVVPRAGGAAVRLPLPHRDLRPEGEAAARLLRAAVPAR